MTAGKLNINIDRNADYNIQVAITEDDGTTPVDLTGYTFAADIREDYDQPVLTSFEVSAVDLANGVISLLLTDEKSELLPIERGVWDLKMTDTSDFVQYVLRGRVLLNNRVTA